MCRCFLAAFVRATDDPATFNDFDRLACGFRALWARPFAGRKRRQNKNGRQCVEMHERLWHAAGQLLFACNSTC